MCATVSVVDGSGPGRWEAQRPHRAGRHSRRRQIPKGYAATCEGGSGGGHRLSRSDKAAQQLRQPGSAPVHEFELVCHGTRDVLGGCCQLIISRATATMLDALSLSLTLVCHSGEVL